MIYQKLGLEHARASALVKLAVRSNSATPNDFNGKSIMRIMMRAAIRAFYGLTVCDGQRCQKGSAVRRLYAG